MPYATIPKEERLTTDRKLLLTIPEAADYTGIGVNRLRKLAQAPGKRIGLKNGGRILIRRAALESFLEEVDEF